MEMSIIQEKKINFLYKPIRYDDLCISSIHDVHDIKWRL